MTKRKELTYSDLSEAARNLLQEIVQIAETHRRHCANKFEKENFGEVLFASCGLGIVLALYPPADESSAAYNEWLDNPTNQKLLDFLNCSNRIKNPGYHQAITNEGLAKIHSKVDKAFSIWSILTAQQADLFEDRMAA